METATLVLYVLLLSTKLEFLFYLIRATVISGAIILEEDGFQDLNHIENL